MARSSLVSDKDLAGYGKKSSSSGSSGSTGKLILAAEAAKSVTLGDLKVTVVGPMQPQLLALQKEHDKWLRAQQEKKKKSPEAALAAFKDESIPNLSSIVVLAELGGKSMLLTGDARGDKILEGMELAGLLEKNGNRHFRFEGLSL